MTLEEAIVAMLKATVSVQAVLGNPARIHPNDKTPEDEAFPYACYKQASREYTQTLKGSLPTNLYGMRIDCYGTTYTSMEATADAIRDALRNYSGTIGSGTVRVLGAFHADEEDAYYPPDDDSQVGVHQRGLTVNIWWRVSG